MFKFRFKKNAEYCIIIEDYVKEMGQRNPGGNTFSNFNGFNIYMGIFSDNGFISTGI